MKISMREYAAFRLSDRDGTHKTEFYPEGYEHYNAIHRGRNLFQQYCVDTWARIEENTLNFHRMNQSKLRSETYKDLQEVTDRNRTGGPPSREELERRGKKVILANSYPGGDTYMKKKCADAMAIARERGRPSFFITMTCNPNWEEIKRELSRFH